MKLIFPGSFDPITNGHLDIIKRASKLCDELIVAVLVNTSKKPVFDLQTKIDYIMKVTANISNVNVSSFEGLLIDYAKDVNADGIIKGLRNTIDFELESQMAALNYNMSDGLETLFLVADNNHVNISSTMVREIGKLGGSLKGLVPEIIEDDITEILSN